MPGLSTDEARARLRKDGPNEIAQTRPISRLALLARQFNSALVWLLLAACVVAILLGDIWDGVAIMAIVIVNAWVGFFQEYRAEQALRALRAMTAPRARVLRDAHLVIVPAAEAVVGDLLVLEAGDVVAADAVLLESNLLTVNEAVLTGESLPVEKDTVPRPSDAPLAERRNSVFMGTSVATGAARAEVIATGMRTEFGRIAHLLADTEVRTTPLQNRLTAVARMLLVACLGVVAVVAILGLIHHQPWLEVLLTSVSLAVAAVPEGLPAIVTIALALGVRRLVARHVLVRRLPAVETLGCVTTICTDKTGTLTTGSMSAREYWGNDEQAILFAAVACVDAELNVDETGGTGDPTEIALLMAAARHGIRRENIEKERPRVSTIPFDSSRKYMAVKRADGVLYVKGASEVILRLCSTHTEGAAEANSDLAQRGLRVLAVATGTGPAVENLRFVGLVGIADPPRPDVMGALASARRAGIRTIMITGDHPATANAIARELGLVQPGEDLAGRVYARATAEDKLRIVRELKQQGEIVAMTGDGVNDAPALKTADIGIAMGRSGTEVTRETADVVLTDDNYTSIVAAVHEGRGIYENIRKTLVYLLAGNFGELLLMLGVTAIGLPAPLLPLQILWINLVTDGPVALALVTDVPQRDLLDRPPRRPDESLLGRRQWARIAFIGLVETSVTVGAFLLSYRAHGLGMARTFAFLVIVISEVVRSLAARSDTRVFWELGATTNLKLVGVVTASVVLQLAVVYLASSARLFQLSPLSAGEMFKAVAFGLIPVTVLEVTKLIRRSHG